MVELVWGARAEVGWFLEMGAHKFVMPVFLINQMKKRDEKHQGRIRILFCMANSEIYLFLWEIDDGVYAGKMRIERRRPVVMIKKKVVFSS
jgi:hypothetical protein